MENNTTKKELNSLVNFKLPTCNKMNHITNHITNQTREELLKKEIDDLYVFENVQF
jgi:hypothetical protein